MAEEYKTNDNEEITYTTNQTSSETSTQEQPVLAKSDAEIKEEFVKPNKNKKLLFKVLIGIISLLIIILIAGAILYFSGFFEHKEETEKEETQHIESHAEVTPPVIVEKPQSKEEGYKFNIKDINSKKLNDQLANLTNKNIEKKEEDKKTLTETKKENSEVKNNEAQLELEKEKAELEKKKIELEKQKIEQDKIKEESTTKEISPSLLEEKKSNNENSIVNTHIKEENKTEAGFLLFINVVKINGPLYKKYLDKILVINPNVRLCRDEKNRIEIYYGPFKSDEERGELLNKLIKNKFSEAFALEFTKEEFDKRCNY